MLLLRMKVDYHSASILQNVNKQENADQQKNDKQNINEENVNKQNVELKNVNNQENRSSNNLLLIVDIFFSQRVIKSPFRGSVF